MKLYSPSKNAFFAPEFEADYRAAGAWTDDLIEVPVGDHAALMSAQSQGAEIKPDANGYPVAVFPLPETVEQIRERALIDIRAQRAPILTALAGIGYDALVEGDTATTNAVAAARQGLKDLTSLPEFLNATTYDDMKAAVMARYRELADAAPENVQIAFREVFAK